MKEKMFNVIYLSLLATIVIMAFLAVSVDASLTGVPITKNNITVELISNTDTCDTVCQSKYRICYDSINLNTDLNIKFKDNWNRIGEPEDYLETIEIESDGLDCRVLTVHGKKGRFENIDNVPCILGTCFNEFAWWNSAYPFRWEIDPADNVTVGNPFPVNDTSSPHYFTVKVSESMFMYCNLVNCNESIAIANETTELDWENGTSRGGNNPTDTWDTDFLGVYHQEGDCEDSTSNNEDGVVSGTPAYPSGVFSTGMDFDDTDDYIDFPSLGDDYGAITIDMWVYPHCTGTDYLIRNDASFGADDFYVVVRVAGEYEIRGYFSGGTKTLVNTTALGGFQCSQWNHFVMAWDGTNFNIFMNGVISATTTSSGNLDLDDVWVGRHGAVFFDGVTDEIRFSDVNRTIQYIEETYESGVNALRNWGSAEALIFYNITFNVQDASDMSHINFSVVCNNTVTANATSPHIVTMVENSSVECNFTSTGYYGNSSIFYVDNNTDVNVTLSTTPAPMVMGNMTSVLNFDMSNAFELRDCVNGTLQITRNKTHCVNGISNCAEGYEIEYITCPNGCGENIDEHGDSCIYPDWTLYIYIIITLLAIIMMGIYLEKRGR